MGFLRQRVLRLSPLPEDLDEVIRIDRRRESDPAALGLRQADLDRAWDEVIRVYRSGVHPAITINLRYRGKVVMSRSIGHARGNGPHDGPESKRVVARPDTPMCLFSASKAVTALLMHMLAEDGLVDLEHPVTFYAPEFGRKGKENITLHQVLAHRGGIPGLPSDTPLEVLWDEDATWELLCDAKPIITDGSKLAYHAITGGFVLERVLRKVTGADIDVYLDRKIRRPMGMKYFTYGARPEHREDVALNYATGPRQGPVLGTLIRRALGTDMESIEAISNDPRFHDAIIPAGNLVATAAETSAFFQMMLDGGVWRGRRICRPETVAGAVEEVGSRTFDRTLLLPMRYSAGLMLGDAPVGLWGPKSRAAFGHVGLINKFAWADPERRLSASVLTSGILLVAHHLWPFARLVGSIADLAPVQPGRKAVAAA
ncbi:MAG: serine hydrolase domain-containing protein [Gammaproteobacteria bacterium]|jgi:CubicO group peptidase (beta-lactamase class C family)